MATIRLRAAVSPAATEACNGGDDDCDALVDEGYDLDDDGVQELLAGSPGSTSGAVWWLSSDPAP